MVEAVGEDVDVAGDVVEVVVGDVGDVVEDVVSGVLVVVVVVVVVVLRLRHDLAPRVVACASLSLVVLSSPPPPHADNVKARRTGAR
ncbi:hypothetical protein [Noviherbaspirillum autotrophicum]|uniref:Uncharacterized protein n=1 Tax=Noviherbaspirillum autotrophicum TaxID=709839 RepID=A0A0C1Y0A5_9BURK|nr:hypothetical protein [Noviherbaspirillum autotrophicum]KIF80443.1 hypothetical protein TSA66_05820 [Noviherbaspirillum autotrophicum]